VIAIDLAVVVALAMVLAAPTAGAADPAAVADDPAWSAAAWQRLPDDQRPPDAGGRAYDAATLTVGGAHLELVVPAGDGLAPRPELLRWVGRSADGVAAYFRHFPVSQARIVVDPADPGTGIGGREFDGQVIRITMAAGTTGGDLNDDWVLTHEMVHLSFPDLDLRYRWMEEGLATWLEPVVRARRGRLSPERVWGELVDGLPKGLPGRDDPGLDGTRDWGRTYWGGAGWWLLADLGIRERTAGAKSVDDVLRAINAAGADGSTHWTMAQVLAAAHAATGTEVFSELYRRMAQAPEAPDLEDLWWRLGVEATAPKGIGFDDRASEAAFRLAETAPDP
jgi:hypothetical protein